MARTAIAALLAIAVLAVAGCGGSGESIASLSITKAVFIDRADRICLAADAEQPREFDKFVAENKKELGKLKKVPHEATVATDHIIPSVKKQIRELEALKPPDGEARKVEAILAGFRKAVREGEKDPYSIANFWVPAQDPLASPNKVATRYGFEVCNELR